MKGVLKLLKDFLKYRKTVSAYHEPKLSESSRAYLLSLYPNAESELDSVLAESLTRKLLDESLSPDFVK